MEYLKTLSRWSHSVQAFLRAETGNGPLQIRGEYQPCRSKSRALRFFVITLILLIDKADLPSII